MTGVAPGEDPVERQTPGTAEAGELEELLRAAMVARTARVTGGSLRPEGVRPAQTARTGSRWRPRPLLLAGGAVAAALLMFVMAVVVPHRWGEDERHRQVAPAARRVALQGVSFEVPRGWTVWQPDRGVQACVQPPGVPHDIDHCQSRGIQIATRTGDQSEAVEQDDGWQAQPFCWTRSGKAAPFDAIRTSRLKDRSTLKVSGQRAHYRAWRVTCASGQVFTARLWWIPRHELSIRAYRLGPRDVGRAERLVSSLIVR